MKHTHRYLKLTASAAVVAMLLAGTALGANEGGPGMAEDQPVSELQTGGVIRRDSGAEQELPGVSVDSLEGLTYDIRQLKVSQAEDVEQMIVIAGHDGTYARVTLYQKNQTGTEPDQYQWTVLADSEGRMGRNGMGKEIEGDEKTPVGLYTAGMVFGNKENPGTTLPYTHVTPAQYWVGDSDSPHYNRFVDTAVMTEPFDKGKSEHLSAYGDVYNYCLDMGYNPEGTPHLGSALFLHCTNGYGTAGCVGIPEEDMAQIVKCLKPGAKVLLDLEEQISSY